MQRMAGWLPVFWQRQRFLLEAQWDLFGISSLSGTFFSAKKVSRCSIFLARVYLWMRAKLFAFHGGNVMRLLIKGINQISN